MLAHISNLSNGTLTVFFNGKSYTIDKEHYNYKKILDAVKAKRTNGLVDLFDPSRSISKASKGKIVVKDGVVYYNCEPLHNVEVQRILAIMADKGDFKPLVLFLENKMKNPNPGSIEQLYTFLEHGNLPLTEDGCFLAYKAVTQEWKDKYTNKISNRIGTVVKMDRDLVTYDPHSGCSSGLHVGSLTYVTQYASGCDHVTVVKVNPKDVVSVPRDHNHEKCRVCEYKVVCEYKDKLVAPIIDDTCVYGLDGPMIY